MQADAFCSPLAVEKERANSHLRRNCYVNRRGWQFHNKISRRRWSEVTSWAALNAGIINDEAVSSTETAEQLRIYGSLFAFLPRRSFEEKFCMFASRQQQTWRWFRATLYRAFNDSLRLTTTTKRIYIFAICESKREDKKSELWAAWLVSEKRVDSGPGRSHNDSASVISILCKNM